jgi:lysophospholipase L1-like esterase
MKRVLVVSLILNVLLLLAVVLIGVRTSFFEDVAARFGWAEKRVVPNQKADDCLRGWTKSLESLHDTVDVVFIGNSITYGGEFDKAFPTIKICNLGYPSDDLKGMRRRAPQIMALHPKKVFLMGGLNGLSQKSLDVFRIQYEDLVQELRIVCSEAQLYLQSILPVNEELFGHPLCPNQKIVQANEIIKNIAIANNSAYIDLNTLYQKNGKLNEDYTSDGIHLNADAYQLWYDVIRNIIEK